MYPKRSDCLENMSESKFAFTAEQLRTLFDNYPPEDTSKLDDEFGGIQNLCKGLCTSITDGIATEESLSAFEERREVYGTNTTPPPPYKSFFRLFWEAFEDSTVMILCIAAIVSLVLGVTVSHHGDEDTGWIEGVAILVAVLIVGTVTATNEYNKEKQFRHLNAVKNDKLVKVVRGGKEMEVSVYDINVGDLINLATGDAVPADGVFISGHDLKTDESAMTGETHEIRKDIKTPFMLSGCQVTSGTGQMVVTGVGVLSEWGMTLSKLTEERDPTPLQDKLENVAGAISKAGVAVACLTFVALTIIWIVKIAQGGWNWDRLNELVSFFIIGVAIIAVAVPEGLPLAVTIALAYSMKKMMDDFNLVRHLEACETMGGATNICSDKTGTLTQNMMTVVEGYFLNKTYDRVPQATELAPGYLNALTELIASNSTAFMEERVVQKIDGQPDDGKEKAPLKNAVELEEVELDIMSLDISRVKIVGSKTEGALLLLARTLGYDYREVRKSVPHHRIWTFNADRKRMSVIVRHNKKYRLYCKGASESVLADCDHVIQSDGETVAPMTSDQRLQINDSIDAMASRGLRTLVLACRDFEKDEEWDEDLPAPDEHLTFIAVVGIKDPVRPEVPGAVARCRTAGITVRMVTGDNIKTAKFIAKECGILDETRGETAMEGPVFRKLPRREMFEVLRTLRVLARSSPSDKHLLVSRLRELGEVVAVTGDGTNDAPALKVADVGLSMGITGTEVAKEASDIVILNDNFSSIVAAVKWGRGVYDNIRKFLQFQLTVNVAALIIAFISAVSGRGTPLTAVQLLWVNLIMDTMAALALGTEVPDDSTLLRKPYGRYDHLISSVMWRNILSQALFQVIVLFGLIYLGHFVFDVEEGSRVHYTLIFNTFVFCQVFNEINARKVQPDEMNVFSGLHRSLPFVMVMIFTLGSQIFIVSVGGEFSKTTPLGIGQWFACIGIGAWSLVVGIVSRLTPPPKLPEPERPDGSAASEDAAVENEEESDTDDEEEPLVHSKVEISSPQLSELARSPTPSTDVEEQGLVRHDA